VLLPSFLIWRVSGKFVTVLFCVVPAHLPTAATFCSVRARAICRRRDCGRREFMYAYRKVLKLCRLNEILLRNTFIVRQRRWSAKPYIWRTHDKKAMARVFNHSAHERRVDVGEWKRARAVVRVNAKTWYIT